MCIRDRRRAACPGDRRGVVVDDLGVAGLEELSREELLAVVSAQAVVVEQQAAQLADHAARIEALTAQVADLTRRLGQNSGNSSLPPSSDRFVKPDRDRRKPTTRKPGKQPGAPGSTLELVPDPCLLYTSPSPRDGL